MPLSALIYGHRGATDAAAGVTENTLAAYALARQAGAGGVELDVRLGADGSLLLHHDPILGDGRPVSSLTARDRPATMPTLAEALDELSGLVVNIEIKNLPTEDGFDPECRVADGVIEMLDARGWRDRVLVSSFHPRTIDRIKTLAPDVPTGLLSWLTISASDSIPLAVDGGHDAIHPFVAFVTEDLVADAHDAGLAVNVWTVNGDAIGDMLDLGVDGIVTDQVSVAVDAVVSRRSA